LKNFLKETKLSKILAELQEEEDDLEEIKRSWTKDLAFENSNIYEKSGHLILGEIGLSEIIKDKEMNKSNSIYYPIEYHTADQNFKFETSFDIWYFLFLN